MQTCATLLAAIIALASTAAPAAAQVQPAASAAPAAPQTVSAPAPAQPNFGELMSALDNMRGEIAKVQAMNGSSANNIRPVNVAQLNGSNPATLNSAVTRNQSQLNALRNALSRVTVTTMSNDRITVAQFLADNKISMTQVVGADVNSGTLVLFYQKP